MELAVLGPIEVRDGDELLEIRRGIPRVVLSALVLFRGDTVSFDRLIEHVWGDSLPANPPNALHTQVAYLRRVLGRSSSAPIATRPTGYVLDVPPEAVDAYRLEDTATRARRLLATGTAASIERAVEEYDRAIRLWRGLAYADVADRPFAEGEASRLELDNPSRRVGAMLDSSSFHPRRRARDHLRWVATAVGVAPARIDAVLAEVELAAAAHRRVGEYSLGMRQRLGLAAALVGDPELLILDEPANGLDPAGIRWLREWLRSFAQRGGTVFVSSHQLGEVAQMADEVVVLQGGRLLTHTSVEKLTGGHAGAVRVRSAEPERLAKLLVDRGAQVRAGQAGGLQVRGLRAEEVGEAAAEGGVVLHELVTETHTLEDVFFELTGQEESHAGVA